MICPAEKLLATAPIATILSSRMHWPFTAMETPLLFKFEACARSCRKKCGWCLPGLGDLSLFRERVHRESLANSGKASTASHTCQRHQLLPHALVMQIWSAVETNPPALPYI